MEKALKLVDDTGKVRIVKPGRKMHVEKLGVVPMIRVAARPENRLATIVGSVLGGFVPLATFTISHTEVESIWDWKMLLVLGGLLYSAKTVVEWGRLAFQDKAKALGFVVLLEGVMVFSGTPWLSYFALGLLITINAVATGVVLSTEKGA